MREATDAAETDNGDVSMAESMQGLAAVQTLYTSEAEMVVVGVCRI